MDGDTRSRSRVLILVAVAVVVGLAVFASVVLLGDDDSDPPRSGPAPTSALPTTTVVRPGATTTTIASPSPTPTTAATEPSPPTDSAPDSGAAAADPSAGPGYDSEPCVMFRQLLDMVDDASLRSAAAQVGCI